MGSSNIHSNLIKNFQVGSGDICTCSPKMPSEGPNLWRESPLGRCKEVAAYIPTNPSFTYQLRPLKVHNDGVKPIKKTYARQSVRQ